MRPERITPSDPSDTVSSGSGDASGSFGGAGRFSRFPALQIQLEASHLRSGNDLPDLQAPPNDQPLERKARQAMPVEVLQGRICPSPTANAPGPEVPRLAIDDWSVRFRRESCQDSIETCWRQSKKSRKPCYK